MRRLHPCLVARPARRRRTSSRVSGSTTSPPARCEPVAKEQLPSLVDEFTEGVLARDDEARWPTGPSELGYDAIHANYWLSGLAGPSAEARARPAARLDFPHPRPGEGGVEPRGGLERRASPQAEAEAAVMACSEAVLASCSVEADQLVELYGADPDRIRVVPPGVDHAFFAPGPPAQARRAVGLPSDGPLLLFVGPDPAAQGRRHRRSVSSKPCCGAHADVHLVVVGGPSGPHGEEHLAELHGRGRVARARDGCGSSLLSLTSCSPPITGRPTSASYRAGQSRSGSWPSRRPPAERRSWLRRWGDLRRS